MSAIENVFETLDNARQKNRSRANEKETDMHTVQHDIIVNFVICLSVLQHFSLHIVHELFDRTKTRLRQRQWEGEREREREVEKEKQIESLVRIVKIRRQNTS
jgi:hypothetical protein